MSLSIPCRSRGREGVVRPPGLRLPGMDRPPHFQHSRPGNPAHPLLRGILERLSRNRTSARGLHRGPAGGRAIRSFATRQSLACGPPEIVGAPHPPRLRGRSVPLSLRRADACRRVHFDTRRMCGFRVDAHPMVGILTAKGCRNQRRAMWHVGKVDPAPETRRPDKFPGPPPASRPSQGKRKCLSQM